MSKTDVRTRKARFLWLKQELGMSISQIAEMLGKAKPTVIAWGADSRPDSAPTDEAIEEMKTYLLQEARTALKLAELGLQDLEDAFRNGDCPRIIRLQATDEEMAFEKRRIAA